MSEGSMTIRHVPDEWRAELAARAARERRSLQEYMLGLIESTVAHPPLDVVIERARERARISGVHLSVEEVLEARDADRR